MQQECGPFIAPFCPRLTFLDPVKLKEVTQPSHRAAVKPGPRVFFQSSNSQDKHILIGLYVRFNFTFFSLRVCDLQVAVPGSQLLPAHDLPLQVPQCDVRAVKNHRIIAEFGGEFIVNMSHAESEQKNSF